MEFSDIEEEILFSIEKDDIDDFTVNSKLIKNWKSYILKEEKEYLIHYAISKIFFEKGYINSYPILLLKIIF